MSNIEHEPPKETVATDPVAAETLLRQKIIGTHYVTPPLTLPLSPDCPYHAY